MKKLQFDIVTIPRLKSGANNLLLRGAAFALALVFIPTLIFAILLYSTGNELGAAFGSLLVVGFGCLAILTAALRRYSLATGFLVVSIGIWCTVVHIRPPETDGCSRAYQQIR